MRNGLLVMSAPRSAAFQKAVADQPVDWSTAESCAAAREWLTAHPSAAVVVTDSTLRDGNWYCVMEWLLQIGSEADFLVAVPEGLDVSTILEHGVTNVLHRPFGRRAATVLEAILNKEGGAGGPPSSPDA